MTDAFTPGPWFAHRGDGNVGAAGVHYITLEPSLDVADRNEVAVIYRDYAEHQANARLIAAAPDLAAVARAYEQWEADLIGSAEAWGGAFPGGMRDLPVFTEALWDRLLEIQAMRNAALAKAASSQTEGTPQDKAQQDRS